MPPADVSTRSLGASVAKTRAPSKVATLMAEKAVLLEVIEQLTGKVLGGAEHPLDMEVIKSIAGNAALPSLDTSTKRPRMQPMLSSTILSDSNKAASSKALGSIYRIVSLGSERYGK